MAGRNVVAVIGATNPQAADGYEARRLPIIRGLRVVSDLADIYEGYSATVLPG